MMDKNESALRKTYEHIDLIIRLLLTVQFEISKRIVSHDRSKLQSPEWEMFAEMTDKLEGLTYGSPEYEKQRLAMMDTALGHHYNHNRHHPEYYDRRKSNPATDKMLSTSRKSIVTCPVDENINDYVEVEQAIIQKQEEEMSAINNMNLIDIIEMFVDWVAATQRHADGDIYKSIEFNTKRFKICSQLVEVFKNTVPVIQDCFAAIKTQRDI